MSAPRSRHGATLLELLVALAIIAVAAAVSVPALRAAAGAPPTTRDQLVAGRRRALREGRPVTVTVRDSSRVYLVTAFPDGRVAADTALGIDPSSGRPRAGR